MSENEKLRELLREALTLPASNKTHDALKASIRAALSQQPEPAPAQDEREATLEELVTLIEGAHANDKTFAEAIFDAGFRRPAQSEQQPVAWADAQQLKALVRDYSASCAVWNSQGRSRVPLYAAPIAQAAPQDNISVLEAWEAIGHDGGCNPSKDELLSSLRYMAELATKQVTPQPEQNGLVEALEACRNELHYMIERHNKQSVADGSWLYDHQTVVEADAALAAYRAALSAQGGQ